MSRSNLRSGIFLCSGGMELSEHIWERILALVHLVRNRDACSLVCRSFRDVERRTRQHLRLRCTERQIQRAPRCFIGVTALDISNVLHRKGEDALVYTPPKLSHLGECFPNVRRLTCNFGLKGWGTGGLPFLGVWTGLEEVVVKHLDHLGSPETLVDRIRRGALVMSNLNRRSSLRQAWLPLKEVSFQNLVSLAPLTNAELSQLAEMDISTIEVLRLDLHNQCSPSLLSRAISLATCPVLQVWRSTPGLGGRRTVRIFLLMIASALSQRSAYNQVVYPSHCGAIFSHNHPCLEPSTFNEHAFSGD